MALTEIQKNICRLIAENRIASGESYVAGAAALNELIQAPRVSRDVDLFHDSDEALLSSWDADRHLLEENRYKVELVRERPFFVEARASLKGESVVMQWARDSAYRFFPLIEHEDLGLVLHPFDLATNKVLALIGRLEVRDWIDVIECNVRVQPFGYLAWSACGKDPGFSPDAILEHARRSGRYSAEEVKELAFDGAPPDPGELSTRWRELLDEAGAIVRMLPAENVGTCVLTRQGKLFRGRATELSERLDEQALLFHPGAIRGALPRILENRQ
jgi:hypothetical protein